MLKNSNLPHTAASGSWHPHVCSRGTRYTLNLLKRRTRVAAHHSHSGNDVTRGQICVDSRTHGACTNPHGKRRSTEAKVVLTLTFIRPDKGVDERVQPWRIVKSHSLRLVHSRRHKELFSSWQRITNLTKQRELLSDTFQISCQNE